MIRTYVAYEAPFGFQYAMRRHALMREPATDLLRYLSYDNDAVVSAIYSEEDRRYNLEKDPAAKGD